ncbi:MAG: hypothetical protein SCALA702_20970 [Melioribacteraceae bacterium]|nr:MAG: hypothetical protein SCALA702_20970 [Melioribacteraceae bacterium]
MKQTKTITYKLDRYGENSDLFYSELSLFTENFYNSGVEHFNELIKQYKTYFDGTPNKLRFDEEYFFELLSIGVLWNNYNFYANTSNFLATGTMKLLYNFRRKYREVKAEIDRLRGKLTPSLLLRNRGNHNYLSLKTFNKLIAWMEATGEFREEVIRFKFWHELFRQNAETSSLWFNIILSVTSDFVIKSDKVLGKYTPEVDNYIKYANKIKPGSEDYIFCKRPKTDYYLNMVGAELMNIAFREEFIATEEKALLLPACMRSNPDFCKAHGGGLDMLCSGCNEKCNINKYRIVGQELGFQVRIIPHSSDFSNWLEKFAAERNIGVIGVACILNLITGGLEMRKLNIPAQCVFLDYCGCTAHWDADGIPTDINKDQLKRVLGKENKVKNRKAI